MSDSESNTPGKRRSQREKKVFKPFTSLDSNTKKRKRAESDTENVDLGLEDNHSEEDNVLYEESEDDEDFKAPKAKSKAPSKSNANTGAGPVGKKLRITSVPKPPKTTTRKPRKRKGGGDAFDLTKVTKETKITADNTLFNAIMNPSAALQSTVEDFLESLSQTPAVAQAELITCILRACGCNDSVNADEVMDYDGVVDTLDTFTESLKQENSPVYPLTSKLAIFKKFRRSLSELLERLIASSAELGSLCTSDLMATLQTWVIAMSSSQIRSFRHTATVVALEVETALCDVAAAVEKEAEIVGRQREGERKRKGSAKGGGREKEFEGKAAEVRDRRTKLAEFLKEIVDGVFIHRYRDLDPNIRAECVRAMGFWFQKYPGHFLDGAYLRYVGWVLSDASTLVRLEAVKSLSGVYQQSDYIGSLNHFTERFKPRLIEIATSDTELSVRVAVIQVLGAINEQSLLEDEERESLCLLVFDEEAKVRKAVSQFVKGVWEDSVKERLIRKKVDQKDKERTGVKVLGALLVKWGKALDNATADAQADTDGADKESLSSGESSSRVTKNAQVASLVSSNQKSRTALAVDALWNEVEPVSDWEALLDLLQLDHSAGDEDGAESRRGRPKKAVDESAVDDVWRLEEVEESLLLECLLAVLTRARHPTAGGKKGEEENVVSDITRALIKSLPRLFIKYQTDENRIVNVLQLTTLMNLDMYLEMRMITAYSSLWDDVTKQFTSHSSLTVLRYAVDAICHFMAATSLSNTNGTKILELDDELASSLRDAVAGREEIEVASFTEDEVLSLGAISARIASLSGTRDMTSWMEEDEGGKQSNAWDIIMALVERGRLGYREEEQMIEQALTVLNLHIIWKARGLSTDAEPSADEIKYRESLRDQRDVLLEKLVEYAVGAQSNTAEGVKRMSFQILMNLHVLFCPTETVGLDGSSFPTASLALNLDDEVQYRCAGFIQAEIERYVEEVDTPTFAENGDDKESSDSEQDDAVPTKSRPKARGKKSSKDHTSGSRNQSRSRLEREYIFIGVMSTFLRAIRAGAVHVRHGAVLLAHFGRFGSTFDECSKIMVDVLREEGMFNRNPDVVVSVAVQSIKESFTLVLDGVVEDEMNAVALSKQLASSFLIRGAQLSVVRRIEGQYVVQIHTTLLSWIGKRLAAYEHNKNKKSRRIAILFFRVLAPMLSMVDSREALKIKAHMDQIFAQAKVEVLATSKQWEPQRTYEKRLTALMSKDKATDTKGKKSRSKRALEISGDEGEESEVENLIDETQTTAPSLRPKPRPVYRSAATQDEGPITDEAERDDLEDPDALASLQDRSFSKSPQKPHSRVNGTISPQRTPRKRERELDEDGETSLTNAQSRSPTRQATPLDDVQIRRKRARH